jgi:signal transduction histidine kinase
VVVDVIQIEQVIVNLLRNGIDAMTRAHTGDALLTVKTGVSEAGAVELSVSDTGPGLPDEIVSQIFDPFFTTKPEGMGMGLSISRSIIEAHKGHMWADAACDKGTTFHFTLDPATWDRRVEH